MTDIAEAYDEQSEFYDVEGWLNVTTDLQYVILPTALMPDIALEHFDVSDGHGDMRTRNRQFGLTALPAADR